MTCVSCVCQGNYGRGKPSDTIGPQGPNYGLGIGSRIGMQWVQSHGNVSLAGDERHDHFSLLFGFGGLVICSVDFTIADVAIVVDDIEEQAGITGMLQ